MRVIFVDCTTELHEVISRRHLPAPSGLEIHFNSPDGEEVMHLCRNAEAVLVEHSFVVDALFPKNTELREIVFMGIPQLLCPIRHSTLKPMVASSEIKANLNIITL